MIRFRFGRLCGLVFLGALALATAAGEAVAQQPRPTPEQARELLRTRPDLVRQLRERIGASGLSAAQIRARLRAAGYPEDLLDDYIDQTTSDSSLALDQRTVDAISLLGFVGASEADSLRQLVPPADSVRRRLRAIADSASPPLELFGLAAFREASNRFEPMLAGPVDRNYRLGPGDVLVLILTGDVEQAHTLEVNREGFVVLPQVGQLYVANLTLAQLDDLLYTRLGRVYSGVRRGAGATTRFQATVARLRTNQIFVVGDVVQPGSYQVSSAGTVLTALYAAGGPTEQGNFRHIEVRRGGQVINVLDLYAYLLRGENGSDVRLETGDVVFVPPRGARVKIAGPVIRPAIYEMAAGETLADLIAAAGGFTAEALQTRVQVVRIIPPAERTEPGRDRVVLDVSAESPGQLPAFALAPDDSVTVFSVADRRRRFVTVLGNVWTPGDVGHMPGMRLSEALRMVGGPKPDVYLGSISVTRLLADSTRIQLRSAFRDSTGALTDDLRLEEEDVVRVFARTDFRPERYVVITGAVRQPGRVDYREGLTLRDALLEVDGLTEDASLGEAEIARMPANRSGARVAETLRVPLDSSYIFDRDPSGRYLGPPGRPAPASGSPEVMLQPYDNVLILRQPDWELPRTVYIGGQVRFPGRYGLRTKIDRITDLLARAGGLTDEAYPTGVEFYRWSQRQGRIGIDLPRVLRRHEFRDNLILQSGDSIYIPEYSPVVQVTGAVNAPVAVSFVPGRGTDEYVKAAGGYARNADRGRTYVVQPNGKVESITRRFLLPDSSPTPLAGATVVVPERDPADRKDYASIFGAVAQIVASVVAIAVVATR